VDEDYDTEIQILRTRLFEADATKRQADVQVERDRAGRAAAWTKKKGTRIRSHAGTSTRRSIRCIRKPKPAKQSQQDGRAQGNLGGTAQGIAHVVEPPLSDQCAVSDGETASGGTVAVSAAKRAASSGVSHSGTISGSAASGGCRCAPSRNAVAFMRCFHSRRLGAS
jgi:hypothetical protein